MKKEQSQESKTRHSALGAVTKRASDEDFNAAANWFFSLPRGKMIAICKDANSDTPHSLDDKYLVPMWMKFKHVW